MDLNENFVRLRHWPGNVSERDPIWSAIAFEDKGFHFLVCVGCVSLRLRALGVRESVQVKLLGQTPVEHAGGNKEAQSAQRNALAYGITAQSPDRCRK